MKIYDKSTWQIEAGIDKVVVSKHFELVFQWLKEKKLLSLDGIEVCELGSFSDVSLHEGLLTESGNAFLRKIYDDLLKTIQYGSLDVIKYLDSKYIQRLW